jgi:hypothetical protein
MQFLIWYFYDYKQQQNESWRKEQETSYVKCKWVKYKNEQHQLESQELYP